MPKVTLKHPNESFESLLRRFKKVVEKSEILKVLREYEAYEKPSETKKRKKAAAVKRWKRTQYEMSLPAHKREQLEQEGESGRDRSR
ncbi:MAG: 30S ribosomal protein S21 [Thaumarchaeota archaeon]|nr:30S ribosomal protein S21 [Nitrososphaerota archaeon]